MFDINLEVLKGISNMSGSTFGRVFKVTTWGESHGAAVGAVIDGCPSGVEIDEAYIQSFLDRRKPGQSKYTTKRNEPDKVRILSGVFEGKTTGTPISLVVEISNELLPIEFFIKNTMPEPLSEMVNEELPL